MAFSSAFQDNAFQNNAFQTFNVARAGGSMSGGTFARHRWRKMVEDEERERAAAERKRELAAKKAADEKALARAERKAAIEAKRFADNQAFAQQMLEQTIQHQLAGAQSIHQFAGSLQHAAMRDVATAHMMAQHHAAQHAHHQAQRQEDEAILRLMDEDERKRAHAVKSLLPDLYG